MVDANNGNLFRNRLCDQQSIKGVAMVERQCSHDRSVFERDRQQRKFAVDRLPLRERLKIVVKRVRAKAELDGDFPVNSPG